MTATRAKPVVADVTHRTVDLGREEEFVTWQEWCARTMTHMRQVVPAEHHARLTFRITLVDGREFGARQVLTHVVRGLCSLEESRWSEAEAVCDVITGYLFIGVGADGLLSTLAVPPAAIHSVETVMIPEFESESQDMPTPFGFYKREGGVDVPTEQREIEERPNGAQRQ